jgi:hypothetical protein
MTKQLFWSNDLTGQMNFGSKIMFGQLNNRCNGLEIDFSQITFGLKNKKLLNTVKMEISKHSSLSKLLVVMPKTKF